MMSFFYFVTKVCLKSEKLRILLYILLSIIHSALFVIIPLLLKNIVDMALRGQQIDNINQLALELILVIACVYFAYFLGIRNIGYLIQNIIAKMRNYFYQRIISQNIYTSNKINKTKVLHHIIHDCNILDTNLTAFCQFFLIHIFIFIFILTFLFKTNILMFLIFLFYCVLATYISVIIGKSLVETNKQSQNDLMAFNSKIQDILFGLQVIKIFGFENEATNLLNQLIQNYINNKKNLINLEAKIFPLNYIAELLGITTVILCGAYSISKGQMSPGLLIVFLMYAEIIAEPISKLGEYIIHFKTIQSVFTRLKPLIMHCGNEDLSFYGKKNIDKKIDTISLKNIYFKYPQNLNWTLQNINIEIKKGEVIAIVGNNGAGKTTLMNILLGFYPPTKGTIFINSKNLFQNNEKSWRNKISLMPQNSHIFNDSLAFNISLNHKIIHYKKLNKIIKMVNLEHLIQRLPHGIHTILEQKGIELSGGEIQRIALARLLYSDSEILLFDEPCNHLDINFINDFSHVLTEISHKKIIIIIDHRIDFIKKLTHNIIYI